MIEQVWVVRDASGEYLSLKHEGGRTTAYDEATEFTDREQAEQSCLRATDRVLIRDVVVA